jgi:hypothetical protein
VTPDEKRPENTDQENRAIEEGLEELKDQPAAPHDRDDEPPVDVLTE